MSRVKALNQAYGRSGTAKPVLIAVAVKLTEWYSGDWKPVSVKRGVLKNGK